MERKSAKQVTLEKALSLFTVYGYEDAQSSQTQTDSESTSPSYYKHYKKRPGILDAYLIKPTTKQRILEKALNLFAVSGYDGVSVASIATAVGIKAPSLYKHYKSKQDIFDTILHEVAKRMHDARGRFILPMQAEMTGITSNALAEKMGKLSWSLASLYFDDRFVCQFRRMLSLERYHNPEAEQLFQAIFFDDVLAMIMALFAQMTQEGLLQDNDPQIMAIAFYSPLFLLICKADNGEKPQELGQTIEALALSFVQRYAAVR